MASMMSETDRSSYNQEKKYSQANCPICTRMKGQGSHLVRHHHVSSEYVRELAALNGQTSFFCLLCKKPEPVEFKEPRRKLILTSSTLYGVWNALELNLPFHIDIETIVGGRVRDATRALKNFLGKPEKLDIVVVCGLNNIGDGQHINDIIDEMMELRYLAMAHNEDNTVSFATLLLPPKFCSLYVPQANRAQWEPPADFVNRARDIECLNAAIKAINRDNNRAFVNMHGFGVRSEGGRKMHLHETNPDCRVWRENLVRSKLHLTMNNKVKAMHRIAKYFEHNC